MSELPSLSCLVHQESFIVLASAVKCYFLVLPSLFLTTALCFRSNCKRQPRMKRVKSTFAQDCIGSESSIYLLSCSLPQVGRRTSPDRGGAWARPRRGDGKVPRVLRPPGDEPRTRPLARMPGREPSEASARRRFSPQRGGAGSRGGPRELRPVDPAGPQPPRPDFYFPPAFKRSGAALGTPPVGWSPTPKALPVKWLLRRPPRNGGRRTLSRRKSCVGHSPRLPGPLFLN